MNGRASRYRRQNERLRADVNELRATLRELSELLDIDRAAEVERARRESARLAAIGERVEAVEQKCAELDRPAGYTRRGS